MLTPFSRAQAPVYVITPVSSSVVFNVKSSVSITGKFDKWDSTLVFKSADINTGVLDVKIQAASVDTGSGISVRFVYQQLIVETKSTPNGDG
jgi:polyisoprenoid-binding protein YceI